MTDLHLVFQGFALAIGLCVGSFLNVCIARMPEDRSVVSPPSHCPGCGAGIKAYDNIPVLSWVVLGGKCRNCKTGISPLYPTIELLTGLLSLLLYRHLVPEPAAFTVGAFAAWAGLLVFVAMLVGTTYVDLKHYIIPDQFSIYAVPVGLVTNVALGALGWGGALTWQQSIVGALIGGGSLGLVMLVYWLVRREEGMGLGDVKLLAMMGAFLGAVPAIPFIVLVSSVLGSVVGIGLIVVQGRGFRAQVPFGPFLAVAALIYVFFGEEIIRAWLPAFALMA